MQTLAVFVLAVIPTSVQPEGPRANWLIDGTKYKSHAALGADHSIVEIGEGEYRFELRPGDVWAQDVRKKRDRERAELQSKSRVLFDADYSVSYDMLIEAKLPIPGFLIAGQWHATEDAGDVPSNPPFSIELWGSDLVAKTCATTEQIHAESPQSVVRYRMKDIAQGVWHNIRYEIRFSPVAGRLVLWIDGARVYAGRIPLGFNDKRGPYFKFGIYRPKVDATAIIRYRSLSVRALGGPLRSVPVETLASSAGGTVRRRRTRRRAPHGFVAR